MASRTKKSTSIRKATKSRKGTKGRTVGKRWSQAVTEGSDALDLQKGVFTLKDPKKIALSLKRSAEHSKRRKSEPYRSAMSMLTFYINRAGNCRRRIERGSSGPRRNCARRSARARLSPARSWPSLPPRLSNARRVARR
jgi:hypothetical protein